MRHSLRLSCQSNVPTCQAFLMLQSHLLSCRLGKERAIVCISQYFTILEFVFKYLQLSNSKHRCKVQKQPSRSVLRKRCSENMQQIYRRTPVPKWGVISIKLFCNYGGLILKSSCRKVKQRSSI